MARGPRCRNPRRDGPHQPGPNPAHEGTGRRVRNPHAADGRPRGRAGGESELPPAEDGVLMDLKPGYKQTEVGVIPEDWETRPCSALSDLITVGIVVRPTQYYTKQGVPALRSANIREDGIHDAEMVFISAKANALLAKSQVRTGDVLTVRTGYPGTSAVVPTTFAGSNCIDILITRPSKAVSSTYLSA